LVTRLDVGGMDLWAGNLRGCLRGDTSADRLEHLVLELARLADSPACRRLGLSEAVADATEVAVAAVGAPPAEDMVLYRALKDAVDWLRLEGGTRWILALRDADAVVRADAARAAALREVLVAMADAPGLPDGTDARASAAIARIDRASDARQVARCATLALRPPA
jgi:hypothetical protein